MKVECSICGDIYDDYWMMRYDLGSKTVWLCWECYNSGQREAHLNEMRRGHILRKMDPDQRKKRR
jgi:hypothetical protein